MTTMTTAVDGGRCGANCSTEVGRVHTPPNAWRSGIPHGRGESDLGWAEWRVSAGNRAKRGGSHVAVAMVDMETVTTKNVGRRDSALRIAVGFVLAPTSVFIVAPVWIQVTFGAVAAFALVTGVTRYCPLFGLVGVSSLEPSLHSKKDIHRKAA